MIEIVTDSKLITKYQRQFIQQLKTVCIEKMINCTVGYKGNSEKMTAFYSEKYNFWFTTGKSEHNNKYWNAFGLGRPEVARSNSITVEINQPFEGVNRNIGGVFGHSNKGEVLILHRGKIGGGRKGIGKQLFFDNYRDKPIIADDDGFENEFCLIGNLGSSYLPRQVGNFVSEVHRIKNFNIDQTEDFSLLNKFAFTEETSGSHKIKRSGTTTIERTHGIVVNLLAQILEDKGHKIAKDKNRDLFIYKGRQIEKLFEIKTSSSTQDLYSAVGQLLIYSSPIKTKVDLIIVLPQKLSQIVEKRISELGIQILYYQWNKDEPVFENIKEMI